MRIKNRTLHSRAFWKRVALLSLLPAALIGPGWAEQGIYRSVGYGQTAALRDGSAQPAIALQVTGGQALFSAGLPSNIGIGDCLVFDSDNNSSLDAMAIICGRADARTYSLCTPDGQDFETGTPGTTVTWRIHRAYASLNDAAYGLENPGLNDFAGWNFDAYTANHNLTAPAMGFWNLACYADAADTNTANFSGWVTNAANRLVIFAPCDTDAEGEVGDSQRHSGTWADNAFTMAVQDGEGLRLPTHAQVEGVQFRNDASDSDATAVFGFFSTNTDIRLTRCIFKGPGGAMDGRKQGVTLQNSNAGEAFLWNNLFYDYKSGSEGNIAVQVVSSAPGFIAYCYHNTVVNCEGGFETFNQASACVKNCIVLDCESGRGFEGDFIAASTNNLSNDTELPPGLNPRNGVPMFVNAAGKDFHLAAADTAACNQGADLTADAFLIVVGDIDGQMRGSYAMWDIGADELALQPSPTVTVSPTISPTPTQTPTPQSAPLGIDPAVEIAYPNPVKGGVVTFTSRPGPGERITVRVFTAAYRLVWSTTVQGVTGQINRISWNVGGLPPGIYLYRIETGSRKSAFKKLAVIK